MRRAPDTRRPPAPWLLPWLCAAVLVTAPAAAARQTMAAAAPAPAAVQPATKDDLKQRLGTLPSAADLRPTGAVTVTALHAELVQGQSAIYTGNVQLDSNTLKMSGDRLELRQAPDGHYTAKITGAPGHMAHEGSGPDNPPVSAHASTLSYDSRSGMMELAGDAQVTRGKDEINGELIHYDVARRRIEASGGNTGPVTIILQPPPPDAAAPTDGSPPASGDSTPPPASPTQASPAAPPAQQPPRPAADTDGGAQSPPAKP